MEANATANTTSGSTQYCQSGEILGVTFDYIRVTLYCFIISISLFGNMAIISVVYKVRSMRSFTNILICNSAVADILITLVPTVYEVIDILKFKGKWALGGFMCTFLYMCIYLSVAATVITLMIVTVDRYCAVLLPYKKYTRVTMLPYVIVTVWIAAFLFSLPTTFAQKVKFEESYGKYCIEDWPAPFSKTESPKHYTLILFVMLYAVPLILMAYMYAAMARKLSGSQTKLSIKLKCRNKYVQQLEDEKTSKLNDENTIPTKENNNNKHKNSGGKIHKQRVIKMLMAVVLCFGVCWLPVYVIQFFTFFHPLFIKCPQSMPSWAIFFAFFMQYANSALNPLIYFTFSRSYRKGFSQTFECLLGGTVKKSKHLNRDI